MNGQDEHVAAQDSRARELLARLLLTLGALLPYWPLLSFSVLHVTDDVFTSDIWNGELPFQVWMGEQLREHGRIPHWTSQLCSGLPIGGFGEPLGLASFTLLPTAAALDALLLIWILVAAHGTYTLARRHAADRAGAVLAGLAFSSSGYLVCQLKHLGIVATVVWLPLGLALLDRAFARADAAAHDGAPLAAAKRQVALVAFGFVFAEQTLAGFPQSAYICALVYGAFSLQRVLANSRGSGRRFVARLSPLAPALLVACLAAAAGAVTLLPLHELGQVSDRGAGNSYEWATRLRYAPENVLTFLSPYANGDISDGSYRGASLFWEDYGYVGLATFLLALYAALRDFRRDGTRMLIGTCVLAYLIVLGPATPVFRVAFELVPGFKLFRFPTRFMVVVDLCLCVLAAIGLSCLARDLRTRLADTRLVRAVPALVLALVFVTALDLLWHQPRQNPMVFADAWLEPPSTAKLLQSEPGTPRIYSPYHVLHHKAAFAAARGWSDLRPYFELRALVQPNSNLYWGLSTADCYAGIVPSWHEDVWGSHSRMDGTLIAATARPVFEQGRLATSPAFVNVLRTYGVSHVLSPLSVPALEPAVALERADRSAAKLYRVPGARRVRVAERALVVPQTETAIAVLTAHDFDPDHDVVLAQPPARVTSAAQANGSQPAVARIVRDEPERVSVSVVAPRGGYLVLADSYFPGWSARVDDRPAPLYRANLSVRAVPIAPGAHRVDFEFRPSGFPRALAISGVALSLLGALLVLALVRLQRARRAS